jgi:hypothetical protein
MYFLFAVTFGGMGFGVFFLLILPEIMAGAYDMIMPGFIILFVFGGVGVGMGVAFIKTILCGIRSRNIVMNGTNGIGTFMGARVGVTVNNTKYYKLTFSFRDNRGVEHIVKTRSRYYVREVDILRERGTFEIRYIGNHAVATAEAFVRRGAPTQNAHVSAPTMISCPSATKNRKTCKYCGGESEVERSRCLFCGSHKFYPIPQVAQPTAAAHMPATSHAPVGAQHHAPARMTSGPMHVGNQAPQKQISSKGAKTLAIVIIAVMAAPFVLGFFAAFFGELTDGFGTGGHSSGHFIGEEINTDWFRMTVVDVRQDNSLSSPNLPNLQFGRSRLVFEVKLNNTTFDEDIHMHLDFDFYLSTWGSGAKTRSVNERGSLHLTVNNQTPVCSNGVFTNIFWIGRLQTLTGYVVFDIPQTNIVPGWSYFAYEEYHWHGNTRGRSKHLYQVWS